MKPRLTKVSWEGVRGRVIRTRLDPRHQRAPHISESNLKGYAEGEEGWDPKTRVDEQDRPDLHLHESFPPKVGGNDGNDEDGKREEAGPHDKMKEGQCEADETPVGGQGPEEGAIGVRRRREGGPTH